MFIIKYGNYAFDEQYDTYEEAEDAIECFINENFEHHPTMFCEYSIEEL